MATARLINEGVVEDPPVNLNVAGDPVVVLELDSNEAEAVQHFIAARAHTWGESMGDRRKKAESGGVHHTSLSAASVRVYDALKAKGF